MKHSDSIKEIASALAKAQTSIKAAIKDANNPFFKSKYADLASVIEAVRIPLNAQGISFLQPVSSAEHGVSVETVLVHESGEWLSETLVMPVSKDDAQGVGSAITYGRRYGLQSMCGVPSEDDDGNAASKAPPKREMTVSGKGVSTPTTGVWESLDDDARSRLTDIATVALEYIIDGDIEGAVKMIEDAALDADHKTALWTRFDSKARSAMKRAKQEMAMRAVPQI